MRVYAAMLRGINVSGRNLVRMDQLRGTCARLGFKDVETYVQSGNVVFRSVGVPSPKLAEVIAAAVRHDFGFAVPVLVKTAEELGDAARGNPFLKEPGVDPEALHVTFLAQQPSPAALKALEAFPQAPDRFQVSHDRVYLHCPGGYGRTKLSNAAFEKALSVPATTRNWKTVGALAELAGRLKT